MTSRNLTIAALAAAIAMCVYLFGGGEKTVTVLPLPASASGKNPAQKNSSGMAAKKTALDWKHFTALINMDASSGPLSPEVTEGDIVRFLAKHGETAINLVAAFEKTADRRWLDRALELFPSNPAVLMLAVQTSPVLAGTRNGEPYQIDPARTAIIERFKAADPNNPLPWIFSAQEFFKAKQTAEGTAEIRAALDRPAFYTYSNERMDSAQRLNEDMGLHPLEASLFAMAGLTMPQMEAAQQASRSLMEWQKSAADSGDTAAADDALRLTYCLGRTFATPEVSRTLLGQLVGVSMESRALKALPADAQPDWLTVTPAQRLAEMEVQKQSVKDLTADFDWIIQSRNEPLLSEYLRRNRSDGELSALTWLKAQKK